MNYEKTDDPNIIKQIEKVVSEIHLDKLEKQIVSLLEEIEHVPDLIVCPKDISQEIRDLVEEHNSMLPDRSELETRLREKQDLSVLLRNL